MNEKDWQQEQKRVSYVVSQVKKRYHALHGRVGDIKSDVLYLRKHFWEDVTVNLDEVDDVAESATSMKQQAELLAERERSHRLSYNEMKALERLGSSPYFGRIDFKEDGETTGESIYLGIASFLDDNEEDFLVYDWRAPVSSLYYDFPPGPAEYDTPSGLIRGELEVKRQFIIREGEIKSMFDAGVTIGDELLQEVLGKHSDSQMKSIVGTIQREQNQIIRNERSKYLIVQGAAGSGKTSAALQRIAYLLYRYRESLRPDQVVLFSPNPMFNSYISTVLPELGEENMEQATFQEYVLSRLDKKITLESPFDQLEYVLANIDDENYQARTNSIKYKSSLLFMDLIDEFVSTLSDGGIPFKDIKFRGEILCSAEEIGKQFYSLDRSISIPNRLKLISDWLLNESKSWARNERKKQWVEDELQLLDKEHFLKAFKHLSKKNRFSQQSFDDSDKEEEFLARQIVNRRMKKFRSRIKELAFINLTQIYEQLFSYPPFYSSVDEAHAIADLTKNKLRTQELFWEDATPFLYLKEKLEGHETNVTVKHIFIDEAQDYSPFQFVFLKRLFPNSRMTILGDLNQAIYLHEAAFSAVTESDDEGSAEWIRLNRSYRSTRQIVEFTREMMPNGEEIQAFNRNGEKPSVTKVDRDDHHYEILRRIQMLKANGNKSIAVICKTAAESRGVYHFLKEELPVYLIEKDTANFEQGVQVIPSYLSKGVEFDAVIIYDASRDCYGREEERKLFYTACTRAMHELHLFYRDELNPFMESMNEELYTKN